jgi:hypothetical protein
MQIRAPDGLLQRFLAKNRTYGRNPKQGDMRRYWYEGNSENFIYLLYQMDKLEQKLLAANDDDDNDFAAAANLDPLRDAREYYASFQEQTKDLWEELVAPFSRGDDVTDFVAHEEEEDVEGSVPHFLVDRQQDAAAQEEEQAEDEELARYYIQKAEGNDDDDGSHYSDGDMLGDAREEAGISESSEDEWVESIRNKPRRGSQQKPTRANKTPIRGSTKLGGRRRLSRGGNKISARAEEDSTSGAEEMNDFASQKGPTKRAILDESD